MFASDTSRSLPRPDISYELVPAADQRDGLLSAQPPHATRIANYNSTTTDDSTRSTYAFLYATLAAITILSAIIILVPVVSPPYLPPQPPVQLPASAVLPAWMASCHCMHMFNFTWYFSGGYEAYGAFLAAQSQRSPPSSPPGAVQLAGAVTVNDVVAYLSQPAHRHEGVIVDFTRQLPNPEPHPLPRSPDFRAACRALHIDGDGGWPMCRRPQSELNQWLPATTHVVTAALFSAYVDGGTCNDLVPGTVFTPAATFHMQRWTNSPCHNAPITRVSPQHTTLQHYTELIDTVGTYMAATGHFAPQQLPRLIRSLALCPQSAKVLVAEGGIATQLVDVLVERGVLSRDRIVVWQPRTVYHADVVYRSESWPYLTEQWYNFYAHDRTDMQLVHNTMVTDLPLAQRDLIILVKRNPGGPRALHTHDALMTAIAASLPAWPELSHVKVVAFDAAGHVRDHIALFRRALVMVGPHGAGMLNLYWMAAGSVVMEVGYDSGMTMPQMYAEMALHSGHTYWLVQGRGDYDGAIQLNWQDWNASWPVVEQQLVAQQRAGR